MLFFKSGQSSHSNRKVTTGSRRWIHRFTDRELETRRGPFRFGDSELWTRDQSDHETSRSAACLHGQSGYNSKYKCTHWAPGYVGHPGMLLVNVVRGQETVSKKWLVRFLRFSLSIPLLISNPIGQNSHKAFADSILCCGNSLALILLTYRNPVNVSLLCFNILWHQIIDFAIP